MTKANSEAKNLLVLVKRKSTETGAKNKFLLWVTDRKGLKKERTLM